MDNIQYPVTGSSGWGTKINNNFKNISDTIGSINKDSDGDIGTQLGNIDTQLNDMTQNIRKLKSDKVNNSDIALVSLLSWGSYGDGTITFTDEVTNYNKILVSIGDDWNKDTNATETIVLYNYPDFFKENAEGRKYTRRLGNGYIEFSSKTTATISGVGKNINAIQGVKIY